MDNQGNFREQSVTNMQRAVYAGEMSVSDYYERTLDLRAAESCGIDDGSSVTRGLVCIMYLLHKRNQGRIKYVSHFELPMFLLAHYFKNLGSGINISIILNQSN